MSSETPGYRNKQLPKTTDQVRKPLTDIHIIQAESSFSSTTTSATAIALQKQLIPTAMLDHQKANVSIPEGSFPFVLRRSYLSIPTTNNAASPSYRMRRQKPPTNETDDLKLNINVESSLDDGMTSDDGDVQEEVPTNDTTLVSNETESELLVNETGPLMVLMPREYVSMALSSNERNSKSTVTTERLSIFKAIESSLSGGYNLLFTTPFWPSEKSTAIQSSSSSWPTSSQISAITSHLLLSTAIQKEKLPSMIAIPTIQSSALYRAESSQIQTVVPIMSAPTAKLTQATAASSSFSIQPTPALSLSPTNAVLSLDIDKALSTPASNSYSSGIFATSKMQMYSTTDSYTMPEGQDLTIARKYSRVSGTTYGSRSSTMMQVLTSSTPMPPVTSLLPSLSLKSEMSLLFEMKQPLEKKDNILRRPSSTYQLSSKVLLPSISPDPQSLVIGFQANTQLGFDSAHTHNDIHTISSSQIVKVSSISPQSSAPAVITPSIYFDPLSFLRDSIRPTASIIKPPDQAIQLTTSPRQGIPVLTPTYAPLAKDFPLPNKVTPPLLSRQALTILIQDTQSLYSVPTDAIRKVASTSNGLSKSMNLDSIPKKPTQRPGVHDTSGDITSTDHVIGAMVNKVEDLVLNTTAAAKSFENVTVLINKLEGLVDSEVTKKSDKTDEEQIKRIVTTQSNVTDVKYDGLIKRLNYLTSLIEKIGSQKNSNKARDGDDIASADDKRSETVETLNRIVSKLTTHDAITDNASTPTSTPTVDTLLRKSQAVSKHYIVNVSSSRFNRKTDIMENFSSTRSLTRTPYISDAQPYNVHTSVKDDKVLEGVKQSSIADVTLHYTKSLEKDLIISTVPSNVLVSAASNPSIAPTTSFGYFQTNTTPSEKYNGETSANKSATKSSKIVELSKECQAQLSLYRGYSLRGGFSAGLFSHYSQVKTLSGCIRKCCSTKTCTVALMLQGNCFNVRCTNRWLCGKARTLNKSLKTSLVFIKREKKRLSYSRENETDSHDNETDSRKSEADKGNSEVRMNTRPTLKGDTTQRRHEITKKFNIPSRPSSNITGVFRSRAKSTTARPISDARSKGGKDHFPTTKGKSEMRNPSETSTDAVFRPLKHLHYEGKPTKRNKIVSSPSSQHAISYHNDNSETSTGAVFHAETLGSDLKFGLMVKKLAKANSQSRSKLQPDMTKCNHSEIQYDTVLSGGWKSGHFERHGDIAHMKQCMELCCSLPECHVALLMVHCYTVHCYDSALCQPAKPKISFFKPRLVFMRIPTNKTIEAAFEQTTGNSVSLSAPESKTEASFANSKVLSTVSLPAATITRLSRQNQPRDLKTPLSEKHSKETTIRKELMQVLSSPFVSGKGHQSPIVSHSFPIPSTTSTANANSIININATQHSSIVPSVSFSAHTSSRSISHDFTENLMKSVPMSTELSAQPTSTLLFSEKQKSTLHPTASLNSILDLPLSPSNKSRKFESTEQYAESRLLLFKKLLPSPLLPSPTQKFSVAAKQRTPTIPAFGDIGDDILESNIKQHREQGAVKLGHKLQLGAFAGEVYRSVNSTIVVKGIDVLKKAGNTEQLKSSKVLTVEKLYLQPARAMTVGNNLKLHTVIKETVSTSFSPKMTTKAPTFTNKHGDKDTKISHAQEIAIDSMFFKPEKMDHGYLFQNVQPRRVTAAKSRETGVPKRYLDMFQASVSSSGFVQTVDSISNVLPYSKSIYSVKSTTNMPNIMQYNSQMPTRKQKELIAEFYAKHSFKNLLDQITGKINAAAINESTDFEHGQQASLGNSSLKSESISTTGKFRQNNDKDFSKVLEKATKMVPPKDCVKARVLERSILTLGWKAGDYVDGGSAKTIDSCLAKCCSDLTCNVAFFVKSHCFLVTCRYPESCAQTSTKGLDVQPSLAYVPRNANQVKVFGSFVRAALVEQRKHELKEIDAKRRNELLLSEALKQQKMPPTPSQKQLSEVSVNKIPSTVRTTLGKAVASEIARPNTLLNHSMEHKSDASSLPISSLPISFLHIGFSSVPSGATKIGIHESNSLISKNREIKSTQTPIAVHGSSISNMERLSSVISPSLSWESKLILQTTTSSPVSVKSEQAMKFEQLIRLVENLHADARTNKPTSALRQSTSVMKQVLTALKDLTKSQKKLLHNLSNATKRSEIFQRAVKNDSADTHDFLRFPENGSQSIMNKEILGVLHEISSKLQVKKALVSELKSGAAFTDSEKESKMHMGRKSPDAFEIPPYHTTRLIEHGRFTSEWILPAASFVIPSLSSYDITPLPSLFESRRHMTTATATAQNLNDKANKRTDIPTPSLHSNKQPIHGVQGDLVIEKGVPQLRSNPSTSSGSKVSASFPQYFQHSLATTTAERKQKMLSMSKEKDKEISMTKSVDNSILISERPVSNYRDMLAEKVGTDKMSRLISHVEQLLNYTNEFQKNLHRNGVKATKAPFEELNKVIRKEISKFNVTKAIGELNKKLENIKPDRESERENIKSLIEVIKSAIQNVTKTSSERQRQQSDEKVLNPLFAETSNSNDGDTTSDSDNRILLDIIDEAESSYSDELKVTEHHLSSQYSPTPGYKLPKTNAVDRRSLSSSVMYKEPTSTLLVNTPLPTNAIPLSLPVMPISSSLIHSNSHLPRKTSQLQNVIIENTSSFHPFISRSSTPTHSTTAFPPDNSPTNLSKNVDSIPTPSWTERKVVQKSEMNRGSQSYTISSFASFTMNDARHPGTPSIFSRPNELLSTTSLASVAPIDDQLDIEAEINALIPKHDCKHTDIFTNLTFESGFIAGSFKRFGSVQDMKECISVCCDNVSCDAAFLLGSQCVLVHCKDSVSCRTVPARPSKLQPQLAFMQRRKLSSVNSVMVLRQNPVKFQVFSLREPTSSLQLPYNSISASTDDVISLQSSAPNHLPSKIFGDKTKWQPSRSLFEKQVEQTLIETQGNSQWKLSFRDQTTGQGIVRKVVNQTISTGAISRHTAQSTTASNDVKGSQDPRWLNDTDSSISSFSADQTDVIPSTGASPEVETTKGVMPRRNLPLCSYSPISYNVTLRHGLEPGYNTNQGRVPAKACTRLCCDTPGCDVAFMLKDICYTVNCPNKEACELADHDFTLPSARLVFIYRANQTMPRALNAAEKPRKFAEPVTKRTNVNRTASTPKMHKHDINLNPGKKRHGNRLNEAVLISNRSTTPKVNNWQNVDVEDLGDEVLPPTVQSTENNYQPTTEVPNTQNDSPNDHTTDRPMSGTSMYTTRGLMVKDPSSSQIESKNESFIEEWQSIPTQAGNTVDNATSSSLVAPLPTKVMNLSDHQSVNNTSLKDVSLLFGNLKENDENVNDFAAEFDAIEDAANVADGIPESVKSGTQNDISFEVVKVQPENLPTETSASENIDTRNEEKHEENLMKVTQEPTESAIPPISKEIILGPEDKVVEQEPKKEDSTWSTNEPDGENGVARKESFRNKGSEYAVKKTASSNDAGNEEAGTWISKKPLTEYRNGVEPSKTEDSSVRHFQNGLGEESKIGSVDNNQEKRGYGRSAIQKDSLKGGKSEKASSFVSHVGAGNTYIVSSETRKKHDCNPSTIRRKVLFTNGAKGKQFHELGSVNGLLTCVELCCISDHQCDAALLLDSTCYAVTCETMEACVTTEVKALEYQTIIAYMYADSSFEGQSTSNELLGDNEKEQINIKEKANAVGKKNVDKTCTRNIFVTGIMKSGLNAGEITRHGTVANEKECLVKCCEDTKCNVAFLLKTHCYSIACHDADDCIIEHMKPSWYSPRVALVRGIVKTKGRKRVQKLYKKTSIPQPEVLERFLTKRTRPSKQLSAGNDDESSENAIEYKENEMPNGNESLHAEDMKNYMAEQPLEVAIQGTKTALWEPEHEDTEVHENTGRTRVWNSDRDIKHFNEELSLGTKGRSPRKKKIIATEHLETAGHQDLMDIDFNDHHKLSSAVDGAMANEAKSHIGDIGDSAGFVRSSLKSRSREKPYDSVVSRRRKIPRYRTLEDSPFENDFGSLGATSDVMNVDSQGPLTETLKLPHVSDEIEYDDHDNNLDDIGAHHREVKGPGSRVSSEEKLKAQESTEVNREDDDDQYEEIVRTKGHISPKQEYLSRKGKSRHIGEQARITITPVERYKEHVATRKHRHPTRGSYRHKSFVVDDEAETDLMHEYRENHPFVDDIGDEREEVRKNEDYFDNKSPIVVHDDESNRENHVKASDLELNDNDDTESQPRRGKDNRWHSMRFHRKHVQDEANAEDGRERDLLENQHEDKAFHDLSDKNDDYDFIIPHKSHFPELINHHKHLMNEPLVVVRTAGHVLKDTAFDHKKLKHRKPVVIMPKDDYDELNFYREIDRLTGDSSDSIDGATDVLPESGDDRSVVLKSNKNDEEQYEVVEPHVQKTPLGLIFKRPKLVVSEPVHDDVPVDQENYLFIDDPKEKHVVSAVHEDESASDYPYVVIKRKPRPQRTVFPWQLKKELEDDIFNDMLSKNLANADVGNSKVGVLGDETFLKKHSTPTRAPSSAKKMLQTKVQTKKTPSKKHPTKRPTNPLRGRKIAGSPQTPIILSINVETYPGAHDKRRTMDQNLEIRPLTTALPLFQEHPTKLMLIRNKRPTGNPVQKRPTTHKTTHKPSKNKIPSKHPSPKLPTKHELPSSKHKTLSKGTKHAKPTSKSTPKHLLGQGTTFAMKHEEKNEFFLGHKKGTIY